MFADGFDKPQSVCYNETEIDRKDVGLPVKTKPLRFILQAFSVAIVFVCANCFLRLYKDGQYWMLIPAYIGAILITAILIAPARTYPSRRLKIEAYGVFCLEVFLAVLIPSAVYQAFAGLYLLPDHWLAFAASLLVFVTVLAPLFWAGLLSVCVGSIQISLKLKLAGILLGLVPFANIGILWTIVAKAHEEVRYESRKLYLNQSRAEDRICSTCYPILLVHGVFGRDHQLLSYWGRVPDELEKNGAKVYFGNHQSAISVAESGEELTARIEQIVKKTGCEKVNIIAHSKGGLDCRHAIAFCGAGKYIASLTTVSTPHRGCIYADYLLRIVPKKTQQKIASVYNRAMKRLGDHEPDFMAAVRDLSADGCRRFNEETQAAGEAELCKDIFTQSYGSRLNQIGRGGFPMNVTYLLTKHFDGPNDGLVATSSFEWGDRYELLTVKGKRGISHLDLVDLPRQNIPEFDTREFYVQLVADLKKRGL